MRLVLLRGLVYFVYYNPTLSFKRIVLFGLPFFLIILFEGCFNFYFIVKSLFVLVQTGRAMASALNVVQTYHSFADYALLSKAAEAGQVYI